MPHSSLANGFLTGKYKPGHAGTTQRWGNVARYCTDEGWKVIDEVNGVAEDRLTQPAAVVLSWIRSRDNFAPPAVSVSTLGQLAAVMTAVELSDGDLQRLDIVSEMFARD